jgi:hypothetical protein
MTKAKFDKAVAIVQSLPKDGPIKPSQDDQLYVSIPFHRLCQSQRVRGVGIGIGTPQ